jgi:hypothetical protein
VSIAVVAALLTLGERLATVFLGSLGILLTGYAFLGKGFAYIGLPPLFVGEVVLGLGLLALFLTIPKVRLSTLELILLAFIGLGIIRTLPFVSTFGLDAIRDAAVWYYALFALIASTALEKRHLLAAVAWLVRLTPALVLWLAGTSLLGRDTLPFAPSFPGAPVPIFFVKPGDRAIMMLAAAAVLILGLAERRPGASQRRLRFLWTFWLLGVAAISVMSRGGMISVAVALLLIFLSRPTRQWLAPILWASCFIVIVILFNPQLPSGYGGRTISGPQLTSNITSIFTEESAEESGLAGTRTWRLDWWSDIYDYTVQGPYFWGGKGFGVNLASEDGYQTRADEGLRSPHSSHMTILARMGVPGLALWIVLHMSFLVRMLIAQHHALETGDQFLANVELLILAVWLAALINSSFDVYLEGPQAAIWFWSLFGAGLAAMRMHSSSDGIAPPPSTAKGDICDDIQDS